MSHVLIIGSGIAGLTTALRLAGRHEVTVVTKDGVGESNTAMAQGGIAGVLAADDTVEAHVADTLVAGTGLGDEAAVRVLCTEGPDRILELAAAGVDFDRDRTGEWSRGLEGAHSIPRILHAGGDATGKAIIEALTNALRAAVAAGRVRLLEHTMLLDLVTAPTGPSEATGPAGSAVPTGPAGSVVPTGPAGSPARHTSRCTGVSLLRNGVHEFLAADAVILATGGAGQLYAHTTNPEGATGDGLAAAIRAGTAVSDMEFYQFHPTALAGSGFLISEAVRGAGALLLDANGHRFMPDIDRRGELAPRDVVALAIHRRMAEQNGLPCYLDARSVPEVVTHFPSIARGLGAHGFDLAADLIPVTPAAHYFMGGINTDLDGRTNIAGLFAVGEVACSGVHGANRLASNSLLEGAVFGARAAEAIATEFETRTGPIPEPSRASHSATAASLSLSTKLGSSSNRISREELQELAWTHLGVEREGHGLRTVLDRLGEGRPLVTDVEPAELREGFETANLAHIARYIAAQALARQESRGAHTRTDFPTSGALSTRRPESVDLMSTSSLLQEAASC
ncbi:L-aspartate oxidase [Brevibacterium sp. BDJS002]|uniref:L-aspartate oxidase n=1 Tax=Brevibacterium sp. BDJS002 TaxID=3020906 RepID=UPI0023076245|nr:L-aspartate oxidase [Brevibacterium sp. BDJS002]WCE39275.1 L-aspartate oxidase [Brevibacterium sp. BDJS002]